MEHRPDCRVMRGQFFCSCDLRARRAAAEEPITLAARADHERLWQIQKAKTEREDATRRLRRFVILKTPVNAVFLVGLAYVWWLTLPALAIYLLCGSVAWFFTAYGFYQSHAVERYQGALGYLRFFVLW